MAPLDDLDSRPGSATSLLRTVIGCTMRDQGGWLPTAALVDLMNVLGSPPARTRNALARVKARGLLASQKHHGLPGYALAPGARTMLARGDRRIFHPRFMGEDDQWCLISFSVPESNRETRHQLRRRLNWIGCGIVANALWICPAYLRTEVEDIVAELRLESRVALFVCDEIHGADDLPTAVGKWWDIDALRVLHDEFLTRGAEAVDAHRADPTPRSAFRAWVTLLDAWRPIPYLDPGLPHTALPDDWPGRRSIPFFLHHRDLLREPVAHFLTTTLGPPGGGVTDAGRAPRSGLTTASPTRPDRAAVQP